MSARAWSIWSAIVVVTSACCAVAQAEFDVQAGWSDQLFPSFVVSTATLRLPEEAIEERDDESVLGDRQGLLGVTLVAPEDDTPVVVTITCDAIMEPSVYTGTLATADETYAILPKIKYKYDVLARQHQPGPITVTFKVELGEDDEEEITRTLTLRSINDCPFTVIEEDDAMDISFVFAAYVNEQHPFVDKILREALDTKIVGSFTGYQTKDPAVVYQQVYALWHALSKRDVRYSDITTSAAESDTVYSQHVRMIDESINNAQANCVDGSVLLASLLRKIGIEPVLVMVPGHCYLAFYLDAERTQLAALETTMLGGEIDGDAAEIEGVEEVVGEDWLEENSWKTFTHALAIAQTDFTKNAEQFQAGKDPNYQLINIAAARKIGILPIAYQASDPFVNSASRVPAVPAAAVEETEE